MKRTIRKNIYGNWVGFVGRNRVEHFGDKETLARYWLAAGHVDVPLLAWLIDKTKDGASRPITTQRN